MLHNGRSPLVSICMPTFNSAEYIEATLDSLLDQTYINIEIIVVDDHSSDTTVNIINSYINIDSRVKLYTNPKKGACAARNHAFHQSSGEYIMFFDSDDLINKTNIESHINYHLSRPTDEDSVSFSLLVGFTDQNNIGKPIIRDINKNYDEGYLLLIEMLEKHQFNTTICYMTKRLLLQKTGLWDENLKKNQDGEFFARVLIKAQKVGCVTNAEAYWRMRDNSISHTKSFANLISTYDSYKIIGDKLIEKDNSPRAKRACAYNLSYWMYEDYPKNRKLIKRCYKLLDKWGEIFIFPFDNGYAKIINSFLGWRIAKMATYIKANFIRCIVKNI